MQHHGGAELESSAASPTTAASGSKNWLLLGAVALFALNYVFNELMEDSGLHVTILTARLPSAHGNATALAAFRAHIDRAESLADPSEVGALRFELLEHKKLSDIPTFNALTVHNRRHEDPKVPAWLAAAALEPVSVVRLRTVFPERSGWREAVPHIEEGALGEVGRLALLIEQTTLHVTADSIDTFRRGWTDLGYNALSEPGVVRCDLLQNPEIPSQFVARKAFRSSRARALHEASEHYARWLEAVTPMMRGTTASSTTFLDALHPRTSAFPFRSRWATG